MSKTTETMLKDEWPSQKDSCGCGPGSHVLLALSIYCFGLIMGFILGLML